MIRYFLACIYCLPFVASAQPKKIIRNSSVSVKSPVDSLLVTECSRRIFEKAAVLPAITGGATRLADSLSAYLRRQGTKPVNGKARFEFILSLSSQVLSLRLTKPGLGASAESDISNALRTYSYLWKPAEHNGKRVCHTVMLEVLFSEDKLSVLRHRPTVPLQRHE